MWKVSFILFACFAFVRVYFSENHNFCCGFRENWTAHFDRRANFESEVLDQGESEALDQFWVQKKGHLGPEPNFHFVNFLGTQKKHTF